MTITWGRTDGADWHSRDPLLMMLVVAAIVHAVLILGVGFEAPKPEKVRKSLEIALVRSPSEVAPEKADYLAPEHQFGSGDAQQKAIPKEAPMVEEAGKGRELVHAPKQARVADIKPKPRLSQVKAERKVVTDTGTDDKAEEEVVEKPHLNADLLSQQISEVSAEFNKSRSTHTRQPRTVYINSVTAHKYKAAAYERAWQDKVERIGNLNYPDEARRRNLSGGLLLSVGIKSDGSLHSVQVRNSSGQPVLDDAAVRIVRLAAPFAPFPPELKEEADVLVVTRTWKFLGGNRVETGP
jgi:protein TonB